MSGRPIDQPRPRKFRPPAEPPRQRRERQFEDAARAAFGADVIDQDEFAAGLQHADEIIERAFRIGHRGDDILRHHGVERRIRRTRDSWRPSPPASRHWKDRAPARGPAPCAASARKYRRRTISWSANNPTATGRCRRRHRESIAPSPIPFNDTDPLPQELDEAGILDVIVAFVAAAKRALAAGFRVIEIHSAHGYLLHEFLSPLSNRRADRWGGSLENRTRLTREVAAALRETMPADMPLFVRISCTDWMEGGWDLAQSIELARMLKPIGVDLMDCSSGALVKGAKIPIGPGFQVPFAEAIRKQAEIPTGAVGMITDPQQADQIISSGQADLAFLAREMLREPYWALKAQKALGASPSWPLQYGYAVNR